MLTDISWLLYRMSVGRYVNRHIGRVSVDLLTDTSVGCWSICQPIYWSGVSRYVDCVVPENIHTPTMEGIGNSEGVGGQRPRKFQRGGGLYDRVSFQRDSC